MSPPHPLNYDILCAITYWADRRTCVSLMRTCKGLNKAAAKSVLQPSGGIYIWTERNTVLFHRFLHADPSRFQHVREIHIGFERMSPEVLDGLLDDLTRMERLETVGLPNADTTLENFPPLADAIAKLTRLQRLEIRSLEGDAARRLLSQMKADLNSIRLLWFHVEDGTSRVFPWDLRARLRLANNHPIPLLARWRASLKELTCNSWFFCQNDLPQFTQVYPKLRRLSLVGNSWPFVAPFIRTYPNLTRLSVNSAHDYFYINKHFLDEFLHTHRAFNIQSQEDEDGGVIWPHLEELVGNAIDLYGLGLTCRVRRVHIDGFVYPEDLEFLLPVLAYAQPQHLKAECGGSILVDPSQELTTLLRSSGTARLESLVLEFSLFDDDPDEDSNYDPDEQPNISSALSDLGDSLKRLPLRRLRLRLNLPQCRSTLPLPAYITTSFDLEAYVRDLADAIPALEDAVVCIKGGRDINVDADESPTRTAEFVRVRRRGAQYADTEMYEWSAERTWEDWLSRYAVRERLHTSKLPTFVERSPSRIHALISASLADLAHISMGRSRQFSNQAGTCI
ncbi:hypothetical protein L226DRAFT_174961 [Lentinus tigrinus ALCF2SS1-7]|uniref:uncharacterized protein n=1 Tax=Lentinus tigrinus ALCF2SS1-7 TaxID=1328758 RepID=UPI001165D3FF|nr:hypothetical protein L226DRAFT_174961 [Lentinus tigrinus ALCF2SS1-7]